jgi:hypothetical protein
VFVVVESVAPLLVRTDRADLVGADAIVGSDRSDACVRGIFRYAKGRRVSACIAEFRNST